MRLSDKQVEILKLCQDGIEFYSLDENDQDTLMWLADQGYCWPKGGLLESTVYVLKPSGEAYLSQIENEQKKVEEAAKEKGRDRRHDYYLAAFTFFLGVASALLVEHFSEICLFVKTVFSPTSGG